MFHPHADVDHLKQKEAHLLLTDRSQPLRTEVKARAVGLGFVDGDELIGGEEWQCVEQGAEDDDAKGEHVLRGGELLLKEDLRRAIWYGETRRIGYAWVVFNYISVVGLSKVDDFGQIAIINQDIVEVEVHMDYFIVGEEPESIGDVGQEVEFGLNGEGVPAEGKVVEQRDVERVVVHQQAVPEGKILLIATVVLQQIATIGRTEDLHYTLLVVQLIPVLGCLILGTLHQQPLAQVLPLLSLLLLLLLVTG